MTRAGYLGVFGTGEYEAFYATSSWTVPAGISSIRVRVVGAGGAGRAAIQGTPRGSGSGGGYAHATFNVTSGTTYAVTVGAGARDAPAGGTSSFGGLISATGGAAAATGGTGTVVGGTNQKTCNGGQGGAVDGAGGAGAGSQVGVLGYGVSSDNAFNAGANKRCSLFGRVAVS